MDVTARRAEVIRILERYLVEVVEAYDLCPWARGARQNGEVAVDVLWGEPTVDAWVASATELLARPATRVAMVVAPELSIEPMQLHNVRGEVALRIPHAGVAEFHPEAPLDLASPARLVPFTRRSPDPLLQLVPLAILAQMRSSPPSATLRDQAQILGGIPTEPSRDVAAMIADANHATVTEHQVELARVLREIDDDRAAAYARVGITSSR